jgi:hypothetical protein
MKRAVFCLLAVLAMAAVAMAADASGVWSGSFTLVDGANGGQADWQAYMG